MSGNGCGPPSSRATQQSDLHFVFPPECFPSDKPLCLLRTISCPNQRTIPSIVRRLLVESRLCCTSSCSCCIGGSHPNIQGLFISAGLDCFRESSRFRCDTWVRELQAPKERVNASTVPTLGFRGAADFSVPAARPRKFHTTGIHLLLYSSICPTACAHWQQHRAAPGRSLHTHRGETDVFQTQAGHTNPQASPPVALQHCRAAAAESCQSTKTVGLAMNMRSEVFLVQGYK